MMNPLTDDFSTLLQQISLGNINLDQLSNADLAALKKVLTPRITKYIPHTPTPKQAAFLLLDCEEAFYGGSAGGGKSLCLQEDILTEAGWKKFGELTLDDRVLALDGTWAEIEYITPPVEHECLSIHFNNGQKIIADRDHLWVTTEYKNRKYWKDSIRTSEQLVPGQKIPNFQGLKTFENLELLGQLIDLYGSKHLQQGQNKKKSHNGRYEVTFTGRVMSPFNSFDAILEHLSLLGIVYSVNSCIIKDKSITYEYPRVTFTTDLLDPPIKKMANKQFIVGIELAGKRWVQCVRIKHPSHTFMIGKRMVPTHNSDALLMGALQYVDIPGYSAILFRKTYADLTKPGALMDRAKEWLLPFPEVKWDEKDKKFTFYQEGTKIPVSTIQFGYLENLNDKYNYQGGEYQFIGFDELTHIAKANYLYMFSRLRRLLGMNVPLRVRGASNPPDDDGGAWVRDRFIIEGPREGRVFIPAGLDDNPYLDKESYEKTLDKLDPVTRARLREGNWEIIRKGNMFKRGWFEMVDVLPPYRKTIRWWDMAATDEEKAKKKNKSGEPDYTASLKVSEANGIYYIEDIIRVRKDPEGTEKLQHSTAVHDGYSVSVYEEQEPGSSGIAVISAKSRGVFKGYAYSGVGSTGSKVDRAAIASAAAGNGNIKILRSCRNTDVFFDELESFPGGIHDDMVDCLSGCISQLGSTSNITGAPIIVQEHEDQVSTWLDDDLNARDTESFFSDVAVGQNYFSRFGK